MQQLKDYIASHYDGPLLSGPLLVVCRFYLPVAKSMNKTKKAYLHGLPHWQKPDGDNLEKFLFDCCTRTIWHDDSQVCWIARSKQWVNAEQGYTELFVIEMPEAQVNMDEVLKTIWTQTR